MDVREAEEDRRFTKAGGGFKECKDAGKTASLALHTSPTALTVVLF